MRPSPAPPTIEITFPDLSRWEMGNVGIPYVWRFESKRAGPHVTLQALTHGNEVCGAIALGQLLDAAVHPVRGTLTLIFANVDAYLAFDVADPFASRCLDEDLNRLWTPEVLDGPRQSRELARARALRPCYDATDFLLDLHSMTDPCPPLGLAGRQRKGLELAHGVGLPEHIVIDEGHKAGRRLRDYAFFDDPTDPRTALLIECGQHWERASPAIAMQAVLRLLRHFGMAPPEFLDEHLDRTPLPPQRAIEVTDVVTIDSDDFAFVVSVGGLSVVTKRGTLLARDGEREIRTPYDDCVLIMPARRPRRGETAVRLGRFVS
ncbi:MAG TPA: succinylglutamate desuccinylase/aspartoacylase family protein [Casimicrobiaceae bacterium]|jgi:predicted deacylase